MSFGTVLAAVTNTGDDDDRLVISADMIAAGKGVKVAEGLPPACHTVELVGGLSVVEATVSPPGLEANSSTGQRY